MSSLCGRTIVPALLAGAIVLAACASAEDDDPAPPDRAADAARDTVTIEDVLAEHTDAWMEIDGVEGTGVGLCDDVPCIKIFVSRPAEEFEGVLPDSVRGHPVRLEPTGRFEPR